MVGILCEKPSAARNFSTALGGMTGNFNNTNYRIVHALGHVYEFAQPNDMVDASKAERYKSWDVKNLPWNENDFSWQRVKKKGVSDVLKNLKTVLSNCDEIVIATDVDPTGEGELLAYEVIEELKLTKKRISRMYFDDESVPEIQKAFKNRKIIPDFYGNPDYRKALYRAKFDFLTMQFTRIATTCGDGRSVVRQGRLKSAMVSIVGDGLAAVANYKKIPFYSNRFKDENGNVYTNPEEPVFPEKSQVPNIYSSSPVVLEKTERKSTAPKKLLDLASLSAMLAPKGFKAKQVLDTYQKMYEAQIVSYPRTEDKVISPEQFNDLLPLADKIAAVVGVDKSLLTHRQPRSTHVKAGGAHGANRPGPNVPSSLDALSSFGACAADIYELLAKSYLAMLAEDYIYDSEQGYLEKYPGFKAKSSIPVSMGWKLVFNDKDDDDEDDSSKHLGKLANPFVHEGFPPKPPVPTMKWLMTQLAKHDVGTGATRTSTYAEVTSEKSTYPLLIDKKGKISMAECGEISYRLLPDTHIGSIALTEEMQQDMRDIASGKADPDRCLAKIAGYVIDDLKTMTVNGQTIQKKAGKTMAEQKQKYEGIWNGQTVKFNRVWGGHEFTDEECEALLRGEEINVYGLVSAKTGNTYGVKGKLTEQEFNGNKFVGFERTGFADNPNGNGGVPNSWCGHKFTDDEKKKLEDGEEIFVKGLKSKSTGKNFDANLKYDANEKKIVPRF